MSILETLLVPLNFAGVHSPPCLGLFLTDIKVGQNSSNGTIKISISDRARECSSIWAPDRNILPQIDTYALELTDFDGQIGIKEAQSVLSQMCPSGTVLANLD